MAYKWLVWLLVVLLVLKFVLSYVVIPYQIGKVVAINKEETGKCTNISVEKIINESLTQVMYNLTQKHNGGGIVNKTITPMIKFQWERLELNFKLFKKIYHWRSGC